MALGERGTATPLSDTVPGSLPKIRAGREERKAHLQHVDVFQTQALQGQLDAVENVLSAEAILIHIPPAIWIWSHGLWALGILIHRAENLGKNDDLVTRNGISPEEGAYHPLGFTIAVYVGGIKRVDAVIERKLHEFGKGKKMTKSGMKSQALSDLGHGLGAILTFMCLRASSSSSMTQSAQALHP
jgi:hypothetical protein